jgi:stage II sporulation protein D
MTKPALPSFFKVAPWLALLLPFPTWMLIQTRIHPEVQTLSPKQDVASTSRLTSPVLPPKKQALTTPSVHQIVSSPQATSNQRQATSTLEIERRRQQALATLTPNIDASVELHVAIASGTQHLNLSGNGSILDQNGKTLKVLKSAQTYSVQAEGSNIRVEGSSVPKIAWVVSSSSRPILLDDRAYRGTLLFVADGGRLWAVNYINLRQYLHSVVGAEVSPSWPPQALKAQAIAARSYALTYFFKPVNQLYHLGSDEYYQVYKGVESEADPTRTAVDETAGEFVSYRGGIVESLYAASDDIVAEAFQGHGMSQLGALNLAERGYTYKQILGNYYPKTGVGRVEVDRE